MDREMSQLLEGLKLSLHAETIVVANRGTTEDAIPSQIIESIQQRSKAIAASVHLTVAESTDVESVVRLFLNWMRTGTIVRVLGAGRARLAAAIPANRLAHGGARVYVQDDILPMPHAVNGGGVIAASASGRTRSLLGTMSAIKASAPHITVVGIAKADVREFSELCDLFIGIREDPNCPSPLSALADTREYVISEVLDALVVAAGKLGGFDDRKWRLGHENIGATGPYDVDTRARAWRSLSRITKLL